MLKKKSILKCYKKSIGLKLGVSPTQFSEFFTLNKKNQRFILRKWKIKRVASHKNGFNVKTKKIKWGLYTQWRYSKFFPTCLFRAWFVRKLTLFTDRNYCEWKFGGTRSSCNFFFGNSSCSFCCLLVSVIPSSIKDLFMAKKTKNIFIPKKKVNMLKSQSI